MSCYNVPRVKVEYIFYFKGPDIISLLQQWQRNEQQVPTTNITTHTVSMYQLEGCNCSFFFSSVTSQYSNKVSNSIINLILITSNLEGTDK